FKSARHISGNLRERSLIQRSASRFSQIVNSLAHVAAAIVMARQITEVVVELLSEQHLDRCASSLMQRSSPFGQQRIVGDLLRQRVLEAIFALANRRLFVDEFAQLESRQHLL